LIPSFPRVTPLALSSGIHGGLQPGKRCATLHCANLKYPSQGSASGRFRILLTRHTYVPVGKNSGSNTSLHNKDVLS